MITDAFEGFAHALRILLEAATKAQELLFVDPHEAAGNIEQGLTNVLNAFHSVYDSVNTEKGIEFDWHSCPETATLLALRNARHHNLAQRVRGLYTYHLQQTNPQDWKSYVIVNYPPSVDGGMTFDVPISWLDLKELLTAQPSQIRLAEKTRKSILKYLAAHKLDSYADENEVNLDAIFLNSIPLVVNGARKFVPIIKSMVVPRSLESRFFLDHFANVLPVDTHTHVVDKISMFLPE